jgi:hypothetical protein
MNTTQDIPRCLGVGTQGKNFGVRCTRFAARKYNGYCNSHHEQAYQTPGTLTEERENELLRAVAVAQDVGIDLMVKLTESFNEKTAKDNEQIQKLLTRNKQLEEQSIATEREMDLQRELNNEKSRSEELEYSLASALIKIEKLKISVERLRLLEASM